MTEDSRISWQEVQELVLGRIRDREWKPGELIPNEAELADEFGCARATVNRALRAVAEQGWVDRKRKAGTRVALHPVRKATLSIPVIRKEIEQAGGVYSYKLLSRKMQRLPAKIARAMSVSAGDEMLHLKSVYHSDGLPYVFEDRWINIKTVPEAGTEKFESSSPNEWLVQNAPFTSGTLSFEALSATDSLAAILKADADDPLFVIERTTWNEKKSITFVRQYFRPGYKVTTSL